MKSYEELKNDNKQLVAENYELREKVKALQKQLNIQFCQTMPQQTLKVHQDTRECINKYSTPQQKIKLFLSLFCGREDVFARRWYSAKLQKGGYQPVCKNEWDTLLCDKRKYKCSNCPNRKLKPLTELDIDKHLRGKDVIGVYPLLSNDNCRFLVADFDDENYQEDAIAFKKACTVNGITSYVERSRSGNGAHIWIFFEEEIPAIVARKLGSGLLTYAMNMRSEIKFSSYDRLFPSQDTLPSGGFGNLIALPLQGAVRKNGNSVFVDEDFNPIDDQWDYLANVKKYRRNK